MKRIVPLCFGLLIIGFFHVEAQERIVPLKAEASSTVDPQKRDSYLVDDDKYIFFDAKFLIDNNRASFWASKPINAKTKDPVTLKFTMPAGASPSSLVIYNGNQNGKQSHQIKDFTLIYENGKAQRFTCEKGYEPQKFSIQTKPKGVITMVVNSVHRRTSRSRYQDEGNLVVGEVVFNRKKSKGKSEPPKIVKFDQPLAGIYTKKFQKWAVKVMLIPDGAEYRGRLYLYRDRKMATAPYIYTFKDKMPNSKLDTRLYTNVGYRVGDMFFMVKYTDLKNATVSMRATVDGKWWFNDTKMEHGRITEEAMSLFYDEDLDKLKPYLVGDQLVLADKDVEPSKLKGSDGKGAMKIIADYDQNLTGLLNATELNATYEYKRTYKPSGRRYFYNEKDDIHIALARAFNTSKDNLFNVLPKMQKIYLSASPGGPVEFTAEVSHVNRTGYPQIEVDVEASKAIRKEVYAAKGQHQMNLERQREEAQIARQMAAQRETDRLLKIIKKVNDEGPDFPEKISDEDWLDTWRNSMKRDKALNDFNAFSKLFKAAFGEKTMAIGLDEKDQESAVSEFIDRFTLLIRVYNGTLGKVRDNRSLTKITRQYVYEFQENCRLPNTYPRLRYEKTTTVSEDNYYGSLYAGTKTNEYKDVDIVRIKPKFFDIYQDIENGYVNQDGPGIWGGIYFGNVINYWISKRSCTGKYVDRMESQLLAIYQQRLKR